MKTRRAEERGDVVRHFGFMVCSVHHKTNVYTVMQRGRGTRYWNIVVELLLKQNWNKYIKQWEQNLVSKGRNVEIIFNKGNAFNFLLFVGTNKG